MEPRTHLRVTVAAGFVLKVLGVLGFVDPDLLGLGAMLGGPPVLSRFSARQIGWLLLGFGAGTLLDRLVPARCPSCGLRRSYVVRERASDGWNAVRYRCRACGHVHDTGVLEGPSEE